MKRHLRMATNKKIAHIPVVVLVIVTSIFSANSSENLFRDVAKGDELATAAISELNAYYAKSPGFRYARAITIDTSYLGRATSRRDLVLREHASVLPAPRRFAKRGEELVMEWNGTLPDHAGKLALTRIDGKFQGSYHENSHYHVITPYRSGGKWMTMALVYDGEPSQCGVGMKAKRGDEQVAQ
jgi:hypothetical protein